MINSLVCCLKRGSRLSASLPPNSPFLFILSHSLSAYTLFGHTHTSLSVFAGALQQWTLSVPHVVDEFVVVLKDLPISLLIFSSFFCIFVHLYLLSQRLAGRASNCQKFIHVNRTETRGGDDEPPCLCTHNDPWLTFD